ncbi:hypothetical protein [Ornithinimicrobium sp. INDO-MA30-4]|uniref:hypothetical protein n=1 Tax=Ornithinimicrobium sp. INDO-MA30-4 TaxID=2908651 RepID=UPI001F374C54|nr:hypothetical protein [Ornithinimicrobium sp. INDO-MA30-4]UJH71135.1 hypothetical protein L0A91_04550 [Ornithinimicrobium sp. INDO-MA30-4]
MDDVLHSGDVQVLIEMVGGLADQFGRVELDLVDRLVVDPAPEFLEFLLGEVGFVERDLLRLAVVGDLRRRDV